jgi:hypothetical protein
LIAKKCRFRLSVCPGIPGKAETREETAREKKTQKIKPGGFYTAWWIGFDIGQRKTSER